MILTLPHSCIIAEHTFPISLGSVLFMSDKVSAFTEYKL